MDPRRTFFTLAADGRGTSMEGGASFWSDMMSGRLELDGPWLVTSSDMTADWPHWEMHPRGEELLVLLRGELTLVIDDGQAETRVTMSAGQTWLMQRGLWHRALVAEPSTMLAITAGEGTEHRPVDT